MNKTGAGIRIKRIVSLAAAVAITTGMSVTAYAEDTIYTREELVDELWTQYWNDTAPGEENAEGSLEYHILDEWLNEHYPHTWYEDPHKYTVYDWSNFTDIHDKWREYHQEYVEYWHFNDEDGVFTIEEWDPETEETGGLLYRFEFVNGKWQMIDADGNVVESLDPHGGSLSDDSSEKDKQAYNSYGTVTTDGCLSIDCNGHVYYIYNDDNDTLRNMEMNLNDAFDSGEEELFSELLDQYGATENKDDSSHFNYEGEVIAQRDQRTANAENDKISAPSVGRVFGELPEESKKSAEPSAADPEKKTESEAAESEDSGNLAMPILAAVVVAAAAAVVIVVKKRSK